MEAVKQGLILTEWQGYFMGLSQKFMSALGVPRGASEVQGAST